jgi:hypothetical protein
MRLWRDAPPVYDTLSVEFQKSLYYNRYNKISDKIYVYFD